MTKAQMEQWKQESIEQAMRELELDLMVLTAQWRPLK